MMLERGDDDDWPEVTEIGGIKTPVRQATCQYSIIIIIIIRALNEIANIA